MTAFGAEMTGFWSGNDWVFWAEMPGHGLTHVIHFIPFYQPQSFFSETK